MNGEKVIIIGNGLGNLSSSLGCFVVFYSILIIAYNLMTNLVAASEENILNHTNSAGLQ